MYRNSYHLRKRGPLSILVVIVAGITDLHVDFEIRNELRPELNTRFLNRRYLAVRVVYSLRYTFALDWQRRRSYNLSVMNGLHQMF